MVKNLVFIFYNCINLPKDISTAVAFILMILISPSIILFPGPIVPSDCSTYQSGDKQTIFFLPINMEISPISIACSGGTIVTSCAVTPDLPMGLTLGMDTSGTSCMISGSTAVLLPSTNYTITAKNNAPGVGSVFVNMYSTGKSLEGISNSVRNSISNSG